MIRLRKSDGTTQDISDLGTFVELVNDADDTIMLSAITLRKGALLIIRPGTEDAKRYEELFAKQKVRFSSKMILR